MRNFLYNMKSGTEYLNYGREILVQWSKEFAEKKIDRKLRILDLGLGEGTDVLNIKNAIPEGIEMQIYGLESWLPNVEKAKKNGIRVSEFNIENGNYDFAENFFDIVIANQVLEHTKEIFWIFSQISKTLKPEGIFIVGVPNLASLHNRIALLFGTQPPAIKVLGPHVRGFTKGSFMEFIELEEYFKVLQVKGSNFYPFPPNISKILSKIFPSLAVSNFYLIQRTAKKGDFIEILNNNFFETPYYRGEK